MTGAAGRGMRIDARIALLEARRARRESPTPELRDEIARALRGRPEGAELGEWIRALLTRGDDIPACSVATLRTMLSADEAC